MPPSPITQVQSLEHTWWEEGGLLLQVVPLTTHVYHGMYIPTQTHIHEMNKYMQKYNFLQLGQIKMPNFKNNLISGEKSRLVLPWELSSRTMKGFSKTPHPSLQCDQKKGNL